MNMVKLCTTVYNNDFHYRSSFQYFNFKFIFQRCFTFWETYFWCNSKYGLRKWWKFIEKQIFKWNLTHTRKTHYTWLQHFCVIYIIPIWRTFPFSFYFHSDYTYHEQSHPIKYLSANCYRVNPDPMDECKVLIYLFGSVWRSLMPAHILAFDSSLSTVLVFGSYSLSWLRSLRIFEYSGWLSDHICTDLGFAVTLIILPGPLPYLI